MSLLKYKKSISILFCLVFLCMAVYPVLAAPPNLTNTSGNLKDFGAGTGFETTGDKANIDVIVGNIIKYFLSFLGVVFLCLLIYGGWLWMSAAGAEEKVTEAKDVMINATIGLAVVLGAYIISNYIVYYLASGTLKS